MFAKTKSLETKRRKPDHHQQLLLKLLIYIFFSRILPPFADIIQVRWKILKEIWNLDRFFVCAIVVKNISDRIFFDFCV
jgi:hypothetical protein